MSQIKYVDPIATLVMEKMELYGPKELKGKYYYGTPMIVAQNQLNLPAAFISGGVDSVTETETNSHDQSTLLYRLTVMIDMKEQWLTGKNRVGQEMLLHQLLIGRDSDFNMLGTSAADGRGSIEYVLRKHKVLDGEKRAYIDLGRGTIAHIRPNLEGRGRGMFLYEGVIEFAIVHNQLRP